MRVFIPWKYTHSFPRVKSVHQQFADRISDFLPNQCRLFFAALAWSMLAMWKLCFSFCLAKWENLRDCSNVSGSWLEKHNFFVAALAFASVWDRKRSYPVIEMLVYTVHIQRFLLGCWCFMLSIQQKHGCSFEMPDSTAHLPTKRR